MSVSAIFGQDSDGDGVADFPTITSQPSNVTKQVGQSATFSVSATGTAPLGYQWRRNGNNISGATGTSYTIPSVSSSDDGDTFQCRVSNTYGTVTSNPATLTVSSSPPPAEEDPPTITSQPSNVTKQVGQSATFSVSATGTAPLSYQWRRNGNNIFGATGTSYIISSVSSSDDGDSFQCRISNSYGTITSNPATLTVIANDQCPDNPDKMTPGACGCDVPDTDTDNDGTPDCIDQCPTDSDKLEPGECGCGTSDVDSDGDGTPNCDDNCPNISNPGQQDSDGDGTGDACESTDNILINPNFESGKSPWGFYTNGTGGFDISGPAYEGSNAARITLTTTGTNMQFFQKDVTLEPNTEYELKFAAYSNSGANLKVFLHKNTSPYTNYGLNSFVDLTTSWAVHTIRFTTDNFSTPTTDTRLRFWFVNYASNGDEYWIDDVVLSEANVIPPEQYDLTASVEGSHGTVSPTSGTYDEGTVVQLTASPDTGYHVTSWSGTDNDFLTTNSNTVTMNDDKTVTVEFEEIPVVENVVINPGFENGKNPWKFYTNGTGSFDLTSPGYEGLSAAHITTVTSGTNIQFVQHDVSLKPNTDYEISFSAVSNTGHNFRVTLCKHGAPYTNYGLSRELVNLTDSWNTYTINFTTKGFGSPVNDARLGFWLATDAVAGDHYWIDNVIFTEAKEVCSDYEGTYTGFHDGHDCNEDPDNGTSVFELSSDCTYRNTDNGEDVSTGRLVISGNSFYSVDDTSEYCGGSSHSGTFEESDGTMRMTGTWSYVEFGGGLFDRIRQ